MVPSIAMFYQYFNLGTQFNSLTYCYLTLIILFNSTHSFTHSYMIWNIDMYHCSITDGRCRQSVKVSRD